MKAAKGLLLASVPPVILPTTFTVASGFPFVIEAAGLTLTTGHLLQKVGDLFLFMFGLNHTKSVVSISDNANRIAWQSTRINAISNTGIDTAIELWYGVVLSTGGTTISVVYSGAGAFFDLGCAEITPSRLGTWKVEATSTLTNSSSTTLTYPQLESVATKGQLYFGVGSPGSTISNGNTSGFNYLSTVGGNQLTYNLTVPPTTEEQPTAPCGNAVSVSLGAIISCA